MFFRKVSGSPILSKHKVKRRLQLDPSSSESEGEDTCINEDNLHLRLEMNNTKSDSDKDETDSCHSNEDNDLKIVEGDLPFDLALEAKMSDKPFLFNVHNVKSLIRVSNCDFLL